MVWWCGVASEHVFDRVTTAAGMIVSDDGRSVDTNGVVGNCWSKHNLLRGKSEFAFQFDKPQRSMSYDRTGWMCDSYFTANVGISIDRASDFLQSYGSNSMVAIQNSGGLIAGDASRQLIRVRSYQRAWNRSGWRAVDVRCRVAGSFYHCISYQINPWLDRYIHPYRREAHPVSIRGRWWGGSNSIIDLSSAYPFVNALGVSNTIRFVPVPQPAQWTEIIDPPSPN